MKLLIPFIIVFLLIFNKGIAQENKQNENVIDIGSNRELFVDHYLIDQLKNVELKLHEPRDEGPVLFFDNQWEGQFSGYCTIIKDGGLYRAYYRGIPTVGDDGNKNEVTCYAESDDGISWRKPDLGIHEYKGSKNNNIILRGFVT